MQSCLQQAQGLCCCFMLAFTANAAWGAVQAVLVPQLRGLEHCRQPLQHTGVQGQSSQSQQFRQGSAVLINSGPGMQQHAAVLQRNSRPVSAPHLTVPSPPPVRSQAWLVCEPASDGTAPDMKAEQVTKRKWPRQMLCTSCAPCRCMLWQHQS